MEIIQEIKKTFLWLNKSIHLAINTSPHKEQGAPTLFQTETGGNFPRYYFSPFPAFFRRLNQRKLPGRREPLDQVWPMKVKIKF